MAEKKVKGGIYYPKILKAALDEVVREDMQGRTLNQIVIGILASDERVIAAIEKLKNKDS